MDRCSQCTWAPGGAWWSWLGMRLCARPWEIRLKNSVGEEPWLHWTRFLTVTEFFANGERWRQLRKFTMQALRDLGMGKPEGEELIQAEVQHLVEALQRTEGHPFDPSLLLAQATSNIVCLLLFDLRFSYEDKEFQAVIQAAGGTLLGISSTYGQIYEMFSWILKLLPGPNTQLLRYLDTLATFTSQQVQQHQGNLDTSGPARDLVDAFLLKMAQEEKNLSTEFTEKNLLMTVTYLLFAGTMTTGATVRYALLLLLKYPEVQKQVREELMRELPAGQAPSLRDRPHLPSQTQFCMRHSGCWRSCPWACPMSSRRPLASEGTRCPRALRSSLSLAPSCMTLQSSSSQRSSTQAVSWMRKDGSRNPKHSCPTP